MQIKRLRSLNSAYVYLLYLERQYAAYNKSETISRIMVILVSMLQADKIV